MHEHTIICRQLLAGYVVGSRPTEQNKKMHWMIKFIYHIFKQLRIWKLHHLDPRCSIASILQLVYYSPCTCIVLYDWLQWLLWVLIDSLHCLCPLWLARVITLGFWLAHCIVCVLYNWLERYFWVFDWFTVLSVSFMIGLSDYFGFLNYLFLVHCIVCVLYAWLQWLLRVFDWFTVLSVSFMLGFSDYFGFLIGSLYCLCLLWLAKVITLGFWLVLCIVCVLYDWLQWLLWFFDCFTVLSVSFMIG